METEIAAPGARTYFPLAQDAGALKIKGLGAARFRGLRLPGRIGCRQLGRGPSVSDWSTSPSPCTPAFKSKDLEFHLLHKDDHGRIGYQKVCKKCGKILQQDDIVKAFEHEKDAYVPMDKEELDAGKAPNTRNLEISLFVKDEEIDTKLYDRPYYVMPAKKTENLYVLLREAIRASGMVGVGKIQFGNKEHLAALKADGAGHPAQPHAFRRRDGGPQTPQVPG